jgi:hypothetical protein
VSIHGFIKGTGKFPIQKCAIFCKFKEIKELRGGVLLYAAQAIPPIDAEIAEKGHLWTETSKSLMPSVSLRSYACCQTLPLVIYRAFQGKATISCRCSSHILKRKQERLFTIVSGTFACNAGTAS